MNKAEAAAGAVVLAIGAAMLFESMKFAYVVEGVPGPGFLPRWIAIGIVGTGLLLTVKGICLRPGAQEAIPWPDAGGWARVALMLGGLAVSLLLLNWLGFVLTTMLFMTVVIFGLGVRSWRILAMIPILAAAGLYILFAVLLSVPLPKGILAFLS
jgi:hypothetical protein